MTVEHRQKRAAVGIARHVDGRLGLNSTEGMIQRAPLGIVPRGCFELRENPGQQLERDDGTALTPKQSKDESNPPHETISEHTESKPGQPKT